MKRRKAIQTMAVVASGTLLLPACQTESWPSYSNIPLEPDQHRLMQWLTEALLPKAGDPEILTPEATSHFVLTMVNDCYAPEDIEKYRLGIQSFQQYLKDHNLANYESLDGEQHLRLFSGITDSKELPEDLPYFLNTTKNLSVGHFTSSEYFLTHIMDWEFVPGRFAGCVPL